MIRHGAPTPHVLETVANALSASGTRHGIGPGEALIVARTNGNDVESTSVKIRQERHPDCSFIRLRRIIDVGNGDGWRAEIAREIEEGVADVAPVVRRRRAFDPDATGTTAPRWAWSVHPVASSLMRRHGNEPEPSSLVHHQLKGEIGSVVRDVERRNGIWMEMQHDRGVLRLTACDIAAPDGSIVAYVHEAEAAPHRMEVSLPHVLPTTMAQAIARAGPGAISEMLLLDPRAARCRITKFSDIERQGTMRTVFTLQDMLVPWDETHEGGEEWRPTRITPAKGKRHA